MIKYKNLLTFAKRKTTYQYNIVKKKNKKKLSIPIIKHNKMQYVI